VPSRVGFLGKALAFRLFLHALRLGLLAPTLGTLAAA